MNLRNQLLSLPCRSTNNGSKKKKKHTKIYCVNMLHFPNYLGTGYAHSSSTAETPKQTVNTRIDCSFWSFYSRIALGIGNGLFFFFFFFFFSSFRPDPLSWTSCYQRMLICSYTTKQQRRNKYCLSKIQTLTDAVLTSTHNLCFEQKYEKYQNYYLKIFIFVVNIFE